MDTILKMIAMLQTPIAKRQGVTISAEDCKVWAEELTKGLAEVIDNKK